MKPITHPPEAVLQAYSDLVNQAFLFLRGRSHSEKFNQEELHDLADAMHNVGGIFANYGAWTDDEKYRELYLRPYDSKWGKSGLRLEEFLDARLKSNARDRLPEFDKSTSGSRVPRACLSADR